jgi:adenine phosphoribosyltransferase
MAVKISAVAGGKWGASVRWARRVSDNLIQHMDYLPLIDRSRTIYKRSDVSPIFAQPAAFAKLIDDLAQPYLGERVQQVAGLDAMGFIVGTALALKLGAGFVPIRKGGKLPVAHDRETTLDYSGKEKALELRTGAFPAGTRVLLADEWIETGAQARAAIALIGRAGGEVVGIAAIGFRKNEKTAELWAKYRCHSLWPEQV